MASPVLELVIEGDPIPKARPRTGRGRTYTPKRTRDAEDWIILQARARLRSRPPASAPVRVDVEFYVATLRRVDVDNLLKLVLDALNGVAWVDDTQVVACAATKQLDRLRPRTCIRVSAIDGEELRMAG